MYSLFPQTVLMSGDHERLFVSTVPGNGSSSTIGSNGGGRNDIRRTNTIRETGNEQANESIAPEQTRDNEHTPIPEDRNDGDEQPDSSQNELSRANDGNRKIDELPGSNQGDGNPEDESIEYMDEVVNNFRRGEITKLKVLSNIISILDFNPSRTEPAKDAAIEYYAKTLNKVEALASSVVKRGRHAQVGLQPNRDRLDNQ